MSDETAQAFDDRAAFGSIFTDFFKASPVGQIQKKVGQQLADKLVAQGAPRPAAQQFAQQYGNMVPSVGDLAKGLAKTTAIAAPALIAVAAPVAVPAIASALGYAAPTAGETGIAALAATSAAAKPAISAARGVGAAIDTSSLKPPAAVSSATGAVRAGMSTAQSVTGKPAAGGTSPASTSSRDALANLLVSVARQVPGVAPPPPSGTINVQPGASLADVLAVVAKQTVGNSAPPLPAAVTSRVSITPAKGLIAQKGFAPVLGVRAGGGTAPRVSRATPSPTQAAVRAIDTKSLPAVISNPVLWTVTNAGLIVRGQGAKSLPQWQVYGSHRVAKVG